jgi:hypothetical protein
VVRHLYSHGSNVFRWNGRNDADNYVSANRYFRIRFDVTPSCLVGRWVDGVWREFPTTGRHQVVYTDRFKAATRSIVKTRAISKRARYAFRHGRTGSCHSNPNGYKWLFNCHLRPGSAWATWRFTRPENSFGWSSQWWWYGDNVGPNRLSSWTSGRHKYVRFKKPGYSWAQLDWLRVYYKYRVRL